jgi:hypothetical protein
MSTEIFCGYGPVDAYLADGFERVPGMSSRFSASICARVLRRQAEAGFKGPVVEIGTFEGRFLVAMALALEPGERAYGFDTFDWPDERWRSAFSRTAARTGLGRSGSRP